MQPLGRRLREAREAKGLSMREVAERLGVSHTTVSRWEDGLVTPTRENLRLIAERLGIEDLLVDFLGRRYEATRKMARLQGRLLSMKGEQNVIEIFNIGDHVVELLEDGNLLINARVVVLTES